MPSARSVDVVGERLVRALELERVGEVGLEARVEEPLREAERAGRARRRAAPPARRPRRRARRRRDAPVREPERRPPRRPCSPRRASPSPWRVAGRRGGGAGTRRRRRRRGPSLANDHRKRVRVVDEHEVAREREVRAGADGDAVHRRDRRLVELPQLADERLHADAQRLGRCCGSKPGSAGLGDRRRREVHAGAERVARRR